MVIDYNLTKYPCMAVLITQSMEMTSNYRCDAVARLQNNGRDRRTLLSVPSLIKIFQSF